MEENFSQLQNELIEAIYDSLQNHIYSNAVFLAERLLAENDCEESRAILAECYLAEMKAYKAYHILKDCKSEQNRYKFAIVCLKLNKLKEAEKALTASLTESSNKFLLNHSIKPENVPNGPFGLYLLGLICEKLQKINEAKEFYKKALEMNPTMWSAYEKLLKLGELIEPSEVFISNKHKLYDSTRKRNISSFVPMIRSPISNLKPRSPDIMAEETKTNITNPFSTELDSYGTNLHSQRGKTSVGSTSKSLNYTTINTTLGTSFRTTQPTQSQPQKPTPGSVQPSKPNFTKPFDPIFQDKQQNLQHGSNFSFTSNISGNSDKNINQIKDLMSLLTRLGEPYLHLLSYNCQLSIDTFQKLPQNHLNTGWVLSNIGRAYWECVKYVDAEKYFEEAFRLEPYRLEGLEYYSTCLWHLKKQVELCHLAYTALEKSLFAPEPWIVLGNCFSLQKEHENALKFFNRAIQLNPSFAYAHTLSGHEYVYNEDFQKARKCFENALTIDLRHYNAWWGLGYIYYKQEKYDRAIDHFQKAISINSRNPVLYSYLGMTYAAQDDLLEALKCFGQSEVLDEKNVMNRFQKANVLCKLEKYDQALLELEQLRAAMPKEAPIPQLIGKIYKQLGMIEKAHSFFTLALDLENKDSQKIKAMIDSLHNMNEFNDDNDM